MHLRIFVLCGVVACVATFGCGPGDDSPDVATGVSDTLDGAVPVETDTADTSSRRADDTPANARDCPGEAGCKCLGHGQCDSGLCIDTPDGKRCAKGCLDTCADGFTCTTVIGGADQQSYCVPTFGTTCRPCTKHDHCGFAAPKPLWCINYGTTAGSFCGVQCASDKQCPEGHACRLSQKVGGGTTKACVKVDAKDNTTLGTCACSKVAEEEALATSCAVEEKNGVVVATRCKGERSCASGTLTACEKFSGPAAACVDVPCENAKDGAACDDDDVCTTGDHCKAGKCVGSADICECKATSDCFGKQKEVDEKLGKCAPKYFCDLGAKPHVCKFNPKSVVECTDAADTPCRTNKCHPDTGKCAFTPEPTSVACDDGDVCSSGDACDGKGSCAAGKTSLCECKKAADCVAKDDGNGCNGLMYCDKSKKKDYTCKINPASVVKCADPKAGSCFTNVCDVKTGLCGAKNKADLVACEDGDKCTIGDHCKAGACSSGTNTCKCAADADCLKHEDGNLCNGNLFCNKVTGQCVNNPATAITCPTVDDTACIRNICQPKTGKCKAVFVNAFGKCYDGNPCTVGDSCKKGVCQAGANLCECKTDNDCVTKDDGDVCNGTLYCDKTKQPFTCELNHATKIKCPSVDDTVCVSNVCQKKTGKCVMTARNNGLGCDADNTSCTQDDKCKSGKCLASVNTCGCQSDADCKAKEDGNACNGTLKCVKVAGQSGQCVVNVKTIVVCPPSSAAPCIVNTCDVKTGKCAADQASPNTPCDDGNPATKSDSCEKGACKSGTDISACTTDADCAQFGDGDKCKATLVCASGKCVKKVVKPLACTTKAPCSVAYCDPKTGKCAASPAHEGTACDDGAKCTINDGCKSGSCVGFNTLDKSLCDDKNPCTDDQCGLLHGTCHNLPHKDGTSCGANKECQASVCVNKQNKQCGNGVVEATANEQCDPGIPSHKGKCDAQCKWKDCKAWRVETIAGTGFPAQQDGKPGAFQLPFDIAWHKTGDLYVVDKNINRLARISPSGVVTTLKLKTPNGGSTLIKSPGSIIASDDLLHVAEWGGDHKIWSVTIGSSNVAKVIAGGTAGHKDGTGSGAHFYYPRGLARRQNGMLLVAEREGHRIRRLTAAGASTIQWGPLLTTAPNGYVNAAGLSARFNLPSGVSEDPETGHVWIADEGNHAIRIAKGAAVTTLAGAGPKATTKFGHNDGDGAGALFYLPRDIVRIATGDGVVIESINQTARLIDRDGHVSTIAGIPTKPGSASNTDALKAQFNNPLGLGSDGMWTVYIADAHNYSFKKLFCKQW